ncbi:MAG TPA: hypothetical protein VFA10_00440 [Ktedonobacteraceae bacterium]|nr:hypothetical protein [Ktedonobacteraceae bacterium]
MDIDQGDYGSSPEKRAWPKEITIATTYQERAEWMQKNLIGHTMSGERLEQRPMVQYTDALDFLATPLKLYDILAIRLVPSVEYPRMIDVIATYQPHIFHCAICGTECSKIPDELWTLRDYKRFSWCSSGCEQQIRANIHQEVEDYRREVFGDDPVGVALAVQCAAPFERRRNGVVYCKGMPEIFWRALSKEEFEEAIRQWRALYKSAMQDLTATLQMVCKRRFGKERDNVA